MKNADKFVVGGQVYDVLSPATFGDYMETIGSACINPDGYAENKLFLAYDDNVQKLFRATTAIANSELLIKDTNCEPTTMAEALANALSAGGVSYDNTDSGLTASNVQGAIDEVNGNVETVKSDLSKEIPTRATLGAHNLLPNELKTQVNRGIQITVSADGKISLDGELESIGANYLGITICTSFSLKAGSYKLSGVPSGGGYNKYQMVLSAGATELATDTGNGAEFTLSSDTTEILCVLYCYRAYGDYDGLSIYPMICLALDPSTEFTPYAMTNRELTEIKKTTRSDSTHLTADITIKECGNVVTVNYNGDLKSIPAATWTDLVELPSTAWPDEMIGCEVFNNTSAKIVIRLNTNGKLAVNNYGSAITSAVNGKFMMTYIK